MIDGQAAMALTNPAMGSGSAGSGNQMSSPQVHRPQARLFGKGGWKETRERRVVAAIIRKLRRDKRKLQRDLDMESLNGMAIMECRDYIQQKLGANAATIGGFTSPFFDDLVKALVDKVQMQHQQMMMMTASQSAQSATTNQYVNAYTTSATTTGTAGYFTQFPTSGTNIVRGGGYPLTSEINDDGAIFYTPQDGRPVTIKMPDGTIIEVAADGSFEIKDKDAKVTYRANKVREFNRYLNASDLLEKFIRFCGREAAVQKQEMLDLPLKLFIGWLVLEAAKADKEPPPDDIKLIPDLRKAAEPQCRSCGQPISLERRRLGLEFCCGACFETAEAQLIPLDVEPEQVTRVHRIDGTAEPFEVGDLLLDAV